MSFWVYLLRCSDGSFYTGHTEDLDRRLNQHLAGEIPTCYTYTRRPLELAFSQTFATREEALAAERQIKGWSRKKKEAMIEGDWSKVSDLAKNHQALSSSPVRPELVEGWDRGGSTGSPRTEQPTPVRPEPFVKAQDRPVEGQDRSGSVHGSILRQAQHSPRTDEGCAPRTDGGGIPRTSEGKRTSVRPELVEGQDRSGSVHGSTLRQAQHSPRTEEGYIPRTAEGKPFPVRPELVEGRAGSGSVHGSILRQAQHSPRTEMQGDSRTGKSSAQEDLLELEGMLK